MTQTPITPELLRAALAHISPNLPRDEWARVAMAIKSEYPDSMGLDLFTDWSASGDNFDPKAARATWRSVKAGGGVGIGTLLHLAKEHGFTLPKPDQAPAPPSLEELARRERERAERQRQEQAARQAAQDGAAAEALSLWEGNAQDVTDPSQTPYLVRKGARAFGVRFMPPGVLLVPLRNAAGELRNLQKIDPAGEKRFIPGSQKTGCWHWCGTPEGAPVLILAEGYATAASIHEATGRPVAVAFDAGNLAQVARALRQQWTAALIVVAGYDNQATEAHTGTD